jgi:c-di-GMP-binding flagellar brake protein YcgR
MEREKRREHRHTLRLTTEVHLNEQPLEGMFRCRTENIGLTGAFLPSDDLPLVQKSDVELVLHAVTKSAPTQYHIHAEVVRTTNGGAGLRFTQLDPQEQKKFRRFLLEAKIAARQSDET